MTNRRAIFSLAMLIGVLSASVAKPASFSFSGTFAQDDDVKLFGFTLQTSSTVSLPTWSYGGGTDAAGQLVPNGGFSTVLSLFAGSGALIDFTIAGGCPPQHIDASTGLCGDSLLKLTLGPGTYVLALTEDFNIPNGLNLSDGFFQSGQGNFSGPLVCGVSGAFYDMGCNKRNGNFVVDIVGVDSATSVPDPASPFLAGVGMLILAQVLLRYRKARQ